MSSTGDYHQDCVDQINQFRWQCQCLPPLQRWTEAEVCTDQMAQNDYETQTANAGFAARICAPSGPAENECAGWVSLESVTQGAPGGESCLALMWHEVDSPSGEQGDYLNMSDDSYTKVACGIYVAPDGEVWALQNYSR